MSVTISGTTGVATPGVQNSASETITGNLTVGGNATITGNLQVGGVATNLYPLVSGTAQATTSGTAFDFTGIPSTAKRITVMLAGVVASAGSLVIQIGSGSIVTTGYLDMTGYTATGNVAGASLVTDGFNWLRTGANQAAMGAVTLTLIDASTNTWVAQISGGNGIAALGVIGGGYISLSGILDRIRLTSTSGAGTFTAGKVNILWE